LAERIKAAIENPNGELWFPELTADLAARAWDSLHRDIGLTADSYGTERVLSHSISAPHEIVKSLKACPSTVATAPAISIEALTPECAVEYKSQGVTFYTPEEILQTTVSSCIEDAFAIVNQVPSLMRTVAVLVRSLHVIKPEDEDHDVSFSEPHVPFSIFVSVPEKRIANDALRIAEAIVHEAMHLQLTLILETGFFFGLQRGQYFQGLMQALYVFSVIDLLFEMLLSAPSWRGSSRFMKERRREIGRQISDVQSFQSSQDLTHLGQCLVRKLLYRSVP
jgi:hypothetical protein